MSVAAKISEQYLKGFQISIWKLLRNDVAMRGAVRQGSNSGDPVEGVLLALPRRRVAAIIDHVKRMLRYRHWQR
jgi:hypothetical protein